VVIREDALKNAQMVLLEVQEQVDAGKTKTCRLRRLLENKKDAQQDFGESWGYVLKILLCHHRYHHHLFHPRRLRFHCLRHRLRFH